MKPARRRLRPVSHGAQQFQQLLVTVVEAVSPAVVQILTDQGLGGEINEGAVQRIAAVLTASGAS